MKRDDEVIAPELAKRSLAAPAGRSLALESLAAPAWVVLQLVEECNLRCRMCYEWGESGAYHAKKELVSLPRQVAVRLIEECLPASPRFELFGGEPLLYEDIWPLMRLIREGGCALAFPTNGTLLEKHAENLVAHQPTRLWISLDGPEDINDVQRGHGVFRRVMRGMSRLFEERRARRSALPEVGVTMVVTPLNYRHITALFLEQLELGELAVVSLEMQSWATAEQHKAYVDLLRQRFGILAAPYAEAYVRDPALFAAIDRQVLVEQVERVREACAARGVAFFSQPKTFTVSQVDAYLRGQWEIVTEQKSRCAVPWACAEVSARGDVTTCHTFYDLPLGNVHEESLLAIWRGPRLRELRAHLRTGLLPICTACCRYYQ